MTAQYHYRVYENNELIWQKCLVRILKNKNKTYLVELLNFCGDRKPGDTIQVNKKSIRF